MSIQFRHSTSASLTVFCMTTEPLNPERQSFGARLAAARTAAALTGQTVGQRLGYKGDRKVVSSWETGRAVPDAITLKRLCRLYNVTADSLLWGAEDTDRPDNAGLDPALAERLARATPDQRALVRQLILTTLDGLHVPAAPPEKQRRAA